ncbi:hypothetical protein [Anaeromyxobacter oryzae]|uniref:Uncharacterized protein n=1 Tax=Anaeromyxobacter oryzae TaxID=2918170 RepID=A0ABM7WV21_9BACT|nr:hypothetical protein [Anaeromyxobacter oryzae]BDG03306.1 hypothetical protein AMOR_23020 [Anaeromyxobacter oryzae]
MARWAGWGAGPAGAGATGGPSRVFLVIALLGAIVVTVISAVRRELPAAAVAGLAAIYFALRLFAGLGRGER